MANARVTKETFEIPCRTFGCFNKASYRIGNPSGSPMAFFHICEDCLNNIMETIPEDKKPIIRVEVEKVVEVKSAPTLAEARAVLKFEEEKKKAREKVNKAKSKVKKEEE